MKTNEFLRRAEEERQKALSTKSECARTMHQQLAEQFERRAAWAAKNNADGVAP
jgi:predicted  nucleic acid-binding Zn-ribbon protein